MEKPEITPAMLEAGVLAAELEGYEYGYGEEEALVTRVFRAMLLLSPLAASHARLLEAAKLGLDVGEDFAREYEGTSMMPAAMARLGPIRAAIADAETYAMENTALAPEELTELRERVRASGFEIVPVDIGDAVVKATDDNGDLIFDGGMEHYFRNEAEARWYGAQVWRGLLRAAVAEA